jgi:hypothetical protein
MEIMILTNLKRLISWKPVRVALLCLAILGACRLFLTITSLQAKAQDISDIENYLKINIPKDATGLNADIGDVRDFYINLSFKASSSNILAFASHFCGGVLHQGYDPFNDIKADDAVPGSFKVEMMHPFSYSFYSYSPRTSPLKVGVYCEVESDNYFILIDESNPTFYGLKFKDVLWAGYPGAMYADVKPVADFPIMVRGLMPELHGRYSAGEPTCFDFDPDAVNGSSGKWSSLIGADVQISIDGKAMTAAYVSSDGRLTRKDGINNYSDPDGKFFTYCLQIWVTGTHTITVQIPPGISSQSAYSWDIDGETSASCEGDSTDCYGT